MKPDLIMPFDGNAFFQAVQGESNIVIVAYLRLIWYYWHHCHCEGLENDEPRLMRICMVNDKEWPIVRRAIFSDDFFSMDGNGLWRQKRADELWEESLAKYEKATNRAIKAARARWNGVP